MKNVILITACAVLGVCDVQWAHAAEGGFVTVNAGHSNAKRGDATAYTVLGGYRWAVDAPFFLGIEGGYADLGREKSTIDQTIALTDITGPHVIQSRSRVRFGNKALLLGVTGKWELPAQYFITAHAGVARYRLETTVRATGTIDGASTEGLSDRTRSYDTNYYAGVGFGYDFSSQLGLALNYDHFAPKYTRYGLTERVEVDAWGVSLEYRF